MLTEFQKRKIANLFAVHDLNRDGALEQSDYVEYARRLAAESGLGPGSTKYEELMSRFLGFWEMLRQMADTNHDNRVTRREWLALFEQLSVWHLLVQFVQEGQCEPGIFVTERALDARE